MKTDRLILFIVVISLLANCPNNSPDDGTNIKSLPYTPYTITYNANGADGATPSEQKKQVGINLTLLGDTISLTKQEYVFGGWNTQKDGKGTHYNAGSEYRLDQSLTLYAEWYSTINTSADFQKIRNDLSGLFILRNDIDLNSLGRLDPIGTYRHPFTGVFNGNGHSFSGLDMNGGETVGFFAYAKNIRVFNLEFTSPHITGIGSNSNVDGIRPSPAGIGVLVGYLNGNNVISNVKITTATVEARKRFAGLLIGNLESTEDAFSIIKYCTVSGSVKGEDDIGGLLGSALRVSIQNCNIQATVTGHAEVGGLAGTLSGNIIKSSAAGQVGGTANFVGGLLGTHRWGEIINSFAMGSVTSSADDIGGLVGIQLWESNIKKSHAESIVTNNGNNTNNTGGLVGLQYGNINNSHATGNVLSTARSGFTGGLVGTQETGAITNSYATGMVSSTGTDGNSIGGLVGWQNDGIVTNSYATGRVNGTENNIGGLVGQQTNSTITDSYSTGMVSGTGNISSFIGGLVGQQTNSTITNSYAIGMVNGTGSDIGGLVGLQNGGSVTNSYATGKTSGIGVLSLNIGGLTGVQNNGGTIANSYATGKTSSTGNIIGGLVGLQSNNSTIINSYAIGMVSGTETSTKTGGLIGWQKNGTITNSYFDSNSTKQSKGVGSGGGTPIVNYSTSDLTGPVQFSGWDFTGMGGKPTVWSWIGTGKWPILQWQYTR